MTDLEQIRGERRPTVTAKAREMMEIILDKDRVDFLDEQFPATRGWLGPNRQILCRDPTGGLSYKVTEWDQEYQDRISHQWEIVISPSGQFDELIIHHQKAWDNKGNAGPPPKVLVDGLKDRLEVLEYDTELGILNYLHFLYGHTERAEAPGTNGHRPNAVVALGGLVKVGQRLKHYLSLAS